MATEKLPKKVQSEVKKAVFEKADQFGYMESGRVDNGKFIDSLVDDAAVGLVLIEYMPKERIRTYIKDGILNAYAKAFTKKALAVADPEKTIEEIYDVTASVIQTCKGKQKGVYVLRSEAGEIYVVSGGTVLKWETALRKALEIIANEPTLIVDDVSPGICLQLALSGQSLTEADKIHIISALDAVGVRAAFYGLSLT